MMELIFIVLFDDLSKSDCLIEVTDDGYEILFKLVSVKNNYHLTFLLLHCHFHFFFLKEKL